MWPFYWLESEATAEAAYYAPVETVGAVCVGGNISSAMLTPPSTCIDGDFLLLIRSVEGNSSQDTDPLTLGWNLLYDDFRSRRSMAFNSSFSGIPSVGVYWKWFVPGDHWSSVYVGGTNWPYGCIYAFRNVDPDEPFGHFEAIRTAESPRGFSCSRIHNLANKQLILFGSNNGNTFEAQYPERFTDLGGTQHDSGAYGFNLYALNIDAANLTRKHNLFVFTAPRTFDMRRDYPKWTGRNAIITRREYTLDVGGMRGAFRIDGNAGGYGDHCAECSVDLEAGKNYTWALNWRQDNPGANAIEYSWMQIVAPDGSAHGSVVRNQGAGVGSFVSPIANNLPFVDSLRYAGNNNTNNSGTPFWMLKYECTQTGPHKFRIGIMPRNYFGYPFDALTEGPPKSLGIEILSQLLVEGWPGLYSADFTDGAAASPDTGIVRWQEFDLGPVGSSAGSCYLNYIELRAVRTPKIRSIARNPVFDEYELAPATFQYGTVSYDPVKSKRLRTGALASLLENITELHYGASLRSTAPKWVHSRTHRKLYAEIELHKPYRGTISGSSLGPKIGLFHHTDWGPVGIDPQNGPYNQAYQAGITMSGYVYSGFTKVAQAGGFGFGPVASPGTPGLPYLTRVSRIVGIALDMDANSVDFYVDGRWQARAPLPVDWGGWCIFAAPSYSGWLYARLNTTGRFRGRKPSGYEAWDIDADEYLTEGAGLDTGFSVTPDQIVQYGYAPGELSTSLSLTYSDCASPTISTQWESGGDGMTISGGSTGNPSISATLVNPGDLFTGTLRVTVDCNSYADLVLADSPLAYWRMQETGGSFFADNMGLYDITSTNGLAAGQAPIVVDALTNYSVWFQRAASGRARAQIPDFSGSWSVEVWFWNYDYTARTETLFSRLNAAGTQGAIGLYSATGGAEMYPSATVRDVNGVAYSVASTLAPVAEGFRNHVVLTYDSATQLLSIYVNGEVQDVTSNVPTVRPQESWATIGADQSSSGVFLNHANAFFSDVAVFNSCLTEESILQRYEWGGGESEEGHRIEYVDVEFRWPTPIEQAATDQPVITDGVIVRRAGAISIVVEDDIDLIDSQSGPQSGPLLIKELTDTVEPTDWVQFRKFFRDDVDVALSDGVIIDRSKRVMVSDSLSVYEVTTAARGGPNIVVIMDDTIAATDTAPCGYATLDDSIGVSDDAIKFTYSSTVPVLDDDLAIGDGAIATAIVRVFIEDAFDLSDESALGGRTAKLMSETALLLITDGQLGGLSNPGAFNYLDVDDAVIRTQRHNRTMSDSFALTDAQNNTQSTIYTPVLEDSISMGDAFESCREFNDAVSLSDDASSVRTFEPYAYDYAGGDHSDPLNPGVTDGVIALVTISTETAGALTDETGVQLTTEG